MKTVAYTPAARRAWRKMPVEVQVRLSAALGRYAATGQGDVNRLTGGQGARLRAGDYRAIFVETADAIEVAPSVTAATSIAEGLDMGRPQIIKTDSGEELVVLSRRDYDALAARGGDGGAEDVMTARILADTAGEVAIPESVWREIEAAPSPIGPLRQWRGLSPADLAAAAGIDQGYLAALEAGHRSGDPDKLRAIAAALGLGVDALTG